MNDTDQIRRCNSAPRADHPLLQAPNPKISNRELLRRVRADDSDRRNDGDFRVTQTKHGSGLMIQLGKILTDLRSNREENAHFQILDAPGAVARSPREKPAKTPNTLPTHPSKVFRVENTSTLYFHKLTRNSTYTHVSGRNAQRRTKHESRNPKTRPDLTPRPTPAIDGLNALRALRIQECGFCADRMLQVGTDKLCLVRRSVADRRVARLLCRGAWWRCGCVCCTIRFD